MKGKPLKGHMRVRDHVLYRRWSFMRQVCNNPQHSDYKSYGGKGVKVDPAFNEFWDFVDIIETKFGYPPNFDASWKLARKDHDKDYTIKNMEWSKSKAVGRRSPRTHILTYKGKTKPLKLWSEELGINFFTLLNRVELNWKPAQVLGFQPGPRAQKLARKKR